MATSGSVRTTGEWKDSGGKTRYLTFYWEETSQSIANNTTTISWKIMPEGTYLYNVSMADFLVTINGDSVYETTATRDDVINPSPGTVIASGTKTITHNADGTKTLSVYIECGIYAWAAGYSGSASWSLDTIPRGASITSAPNFNDEQNPTINYSSPAGNLVTTLEACIADANHNVLVPYRAVSKTGTSYTFNLTEAERNILRNYTPNSKTAKVNFYIRTILSGQTFTHRSEKTLTITNANPTLNPTVVDTHEHAITLTGAANSKIIRGYNKVQITFNDAALKGASIVSRSMTCGSKTATANAVLTNVESGSFVFTVTDSRGNTTTKTISKTLVDYTTLTVNMNPQNPTTDGVLNFTIQGNYFNGNFGAVANTLTVKYRIKEDGGSYGGWQTITPTISGSTYSVTSTITGLDYQKAYVIQGRAFDKIYDGTNESAKITREITVRSIPVFDWSGEDFAFNVPVTISGASVPSITAQGTDGIWTYRKWSDGVSECWGSKEISVTFPSAANWGGLFTTGAIAASNITLPSGLFIAAPEIQASLQVRSVGGILMAPGGASGSTATSTQTGVYEIARGNAVSGTQYYTINYSARGKWK